jgi:Flp pilus assembly protein TadD
LTQLGDVEGARVARTEAERLNRRKADAQASVFAVSDGQRKLLAGDRAGAIARFREAVKLSPVNASAHAALAKVLEQIGEAAEARRHFAAARKLRAVAPPEIRP